MKIILGLIVVIASLFGGWFFMQESGSEDQTDPDLVACTQEAKICPDGSGVGRVGPNCEFAPCPGEEGD